jgi:signal transduction histidine kinase
MRSISLKITLVLVVVSLVGALFTAFYLQDRTRQAFDTFIRDQDQDILVAALTEHYQTNNSWEDVDQTFQEVYSTGFRGFQNRGMGMDPKNMPFMNSPPSFVLASPKGMILNSGSNSDDLKHGSKLSNKELKKGIPIEVDGTVVGLLVPAPFPKNRNLIQQDFFGSVRRGLVISSLATLLIALILGGILIQSFTRPIRKLADATEEVAGGKLGFQVDIESKDELGRLAKSFNQMSTDLERSDQRRKQLTADIAHDLRSPLSVLHGYTEAMNEGKLTGNPEIFEVMHQQAQHLNYLIDDLRTLTLLDSEELKLHIQDIDPGLILQSVYSAFSPLAEEKGVILTLDLGDELQRVDLDPDRLNQILANLLNNALDVLETKGSLQIIASELEGSLHIDITDDGPGIQEEDLPYIFDRFYRTNQSRQADGSSGLGLAISKKLVEAMGGKITVVSEPGKRTTFTVSFPIN